jgi:hypothetical protein
MELLALHYLHLIRRTSAKCTVDSVPSTFARSRARSKYAMWKCKVNKTPYKKKAMVAAWTTAIINVVLILFFFNPGTTRVFPPCPLHWLTGLYCPGCGSLRAVHNLLHGHLAIAISLNPLMVVSIPILGLMFLSPSWIYKRWVPWVAFSILLCYGVTRNIPIWPFVLLAPK